MSDDLRGELSASDAGAWGELASIGIGLSSSSASRARRSVY